MKCNQTKDFLCKFILALILLVPLTVFAQTGQTVKGIVTDASTGETLIGVSVVQKGTTNGTVTDIDGDYSITVPNNTVLVFSYIGYTVREITVSSATLDVQLSESDKSLNEVVVIGYGTQRKADVTTAVSSVSSADWADKPIISAQQALQGKAAGVQVVQNSGKPGTGMHVRVRGTSSLNAGSNPIYVVDGIVTTDITNISPDDIENMQILKDASSAAIYGSMGANGVVMITTKKGGKGSAQIDLSIYTGFSTVSNQIEVLNTKEFYDLMTDMGQLVDYSDNRYINWAKEMYRTALLQNYQLGVKGGNDKNVYLVSLNYQKEDGTIAPANYERFSARTNLSSEVKSWFKISSTMSFARNSRMDVADNANSGRGGVIMSILNTPPNTPIWDPIHEGQYAPNVFQPSQENPRGATSQYDNNLENRFMGNINLDFTLAKGLTFTPSFALDYTSHTWDKFFDPIKTGYGRQSNGRGEHADDEYLTWASDNILTYKTKIRDTHNFTLMGGANFRRYRHSNAYMSAEDYIKGVDLDVMTINMANKINNATSSKNGNSMISYLARVQYDYLSKYLLTASIRADGSSKLYHKWAYYPAISAGWRFSDEAFFKPLKNIVTDAKIRAGWGITGNQTGIGDYDAFDRYDIVRRSTSGEGPSIGKRHLGNRDLTWEDVTQYNLGMDLYLFNSRVNIELDAYYKKTKGLLLSTVLPASVPDDFPMRNAGEMENKGFEFNVNGQILTGNVKWDASANMSFNRNKVLKLDLTKEFTYGGIEAAGEDVIVVREGLPIGSFRGYIVEGVDPETGLFMFKDINNKNGSGRYTATNPSPDNRTIIGNAQPDFTFGFSNNISWKDFTLNAFFQGSYGNDIYNASRMDLEGMVDQKNHSKAVLNRWVRPGMITDVPKARASTNALLSSHYVEDGSYIRLKSLTLNYMLNSKISQKMKMKSINLYVTATNLFTLTKYTGYDPESQWTNSGQQALLGVDYGTYPQSRSFIFGLKASF